MPMRDDIVWETVVGCLQPAWSNADRRVSRQDAERLYEACHRNMEVMIALLNLYVQTPAGQAPDARLADLLLDKEAFERLHRQAVQVVAAKASAVQQTKALRQARLRIDVGTQTLQRVAEAHMREAGGDIAAFLKHLGWPISVFVLTDPSVVKALRDVYGPTAERNPDCFWCVCAWHLHPVEGYTTDGAKELFRCACGTWWDDRQALWAHIKGGAEKAKPPPRC